MKKLFLVLFIIFLPFYFLNAQGGMAVFDALNATFLQTIKADQAIFYAQTLYEYVESAMRFQQQVEQWATEAERYMRQITSFTEIKDYSSFMDWYNRSLEAERNFNHFINSPNIQIGSRSYSIHDLDQLAGDVTGDLHWNNEFTEEQRREMWLRAGLTPANYAYVQPYRLKANQLTYEMLAGKGLHDKWYAQNLEQTYYRQRRIQIDRTLDAADRLSDKELLMMITEALNEQNITMNKLAGMQAQANEMLAIERQLRNAPQVVPPVMNEFPEHLFRPLNDPHQ